MPAEIKARPTLYKGIPMRSRLEANFAAYLDRLGTPWDYEPTCFGAETGQWLPDFRTTLPTEAGSRRNVYVEVKPAEFLLQRGGEDAAGVIERVDEILTRMTVAWFSEPTTLLELVFWTYGACGPDYAVLGAKEISWQSWDGDSAPGLWPGMSQTGATVPLVTS